MLEFNASCMSNGTFYVVNKSLKDLWACGQEDEARDRAKKAHLETMAANETFKTLKLLRQEQARQLDQANAGKTFTFTSFNSRKHDSPHLN
jgi:hypothetical protein